MFKKNAKQYGLAANPTVADLGFCRQKNINKIV